MTVSEFALFPTRLLTIQFPEVASLNEELYRLLTAGEAFRDGFDMHPASLNLLTLAESSPAIARVRRMFLDGLTRFLQAEEVKGELTAEMVLFQTPGTLRELHPALRPGQRGVDPDDRGVVRRDSL